MQTPRSPRPWGPKGPASLLGASVSTNERNWTKPSLELFPGLMFTEAMTTRCCLLPLPRRQRDTELWDSTRVCQTPATEATQTLREPCGWDPVRGSARPLEGKALTGGSWRVCILSQWLWSGGPTDRADESCFVDGCGWPLQCGLELRAVSTH